MSDYPKGTILVKVSMSSRSLPEFYLIYDETGYGEDKILNLLLLRKTLSIRSPFIYLSDIPKHRKSLLSLLSAKLTPTEFISSLAYHEHLNPVIKKIRADLIHYEREIMSLEQYLQTSYHGITEANAYALMKLQGQLYSSGVSPANHNHILSNGL